MDPRGERFEHERADAGRRLVLTINGANAQVDARRFICRVHHACVLVARLAEERKLEIDTSRPTLHSPPCAGFLKRNDMGAYEDLVARKLRFQSGKGLDVAPRDYGLFPHQRDLVEWALRRGRAAIFADTGLGKSRIQVAWADTIARETGGDVLILAPLAVAEQTVEEGESIGVKVTHARDGADIQPGINITNYARIHRFDCSRFTGVVLDESSIIKHHTSKTLQQLLEAFERTPFKLCATATPAPNDWTELGTHAQFLGCRTQDEMLAEFFVHDGGDTGTWRLKGHAKHLFWKWVASWGALLRSPADLGHDATAYELPPLEVTQHTVEGGIEPTEGMLFALEASSLMERRAARRASLAARVKACAAMVNADNQPWIVWCDLNDEADSLRAAIPDAVEIRGSDEDEAKERRLYDFAHGKIRVLITKPKIAGFGLNWQHCANVAFVGVTDSFEAYYQAIRRCWRFGQKRPVHVHIFASEQEGSVVANLARKEADAKAMAESLSAETLEAVRESVLGFSRETNDYAPSVPMAIPSFLRKTA